MSEPVVLFFLLGLIARFVRSDLKIPGAFYEALSIYLLLAIGLHGGVKLTEYPLSEIFFTGGMVVLVAAIIPLLAFPILRFLGRLPRPDAASIAAHYGSVSVVTFSVAVAFLMQHNVDYEGFMVVFLVLLEFPALVLGVILARVGNQSAECQWGKLLHEVFAGKSLLLLIGGLIIGYAAGHDYIKPMEPLFFDLFKGVLALFLLEMGLVAGSQMRLLRQYGLFISLFGILMPMFSAVLGLITAWLLGLSLGGAMLLATLYASASYIAAPAAMRIAVPEANPGLSIAASLGVTFPFNIFIGIHLYFWLAQRLYGVSS